MTRMQRSNPREPNWGSMDLGRYQVATIPTEVQLELAALERPLLAPEALVPPPPLTYSETLAETTEIDRPVSSTRRLKPYGYAVLGGVVFFAFLFAWCFDVL